MKFAILTSYAFGITAAAMVMAGCSSNQVSPLGASSGAPLNGLPMIAEHPNFGSRSNFVPVMQANHKKNGLYQFVSAYDEIIEFDYPKGNEPIGEITGISAGGECADILYGAAKRDFWETESGELAEYAIGRTKPIKTLPVGSGGQPASCAMDPTTGNLAATLLNGGVVIFQNASGSGTILAPGMTAYFDGYDSHGNLYVDGFNSHGQTAMAELPKGSSTFQTVTLSNSVQFPGAVQYDGTYMTLGDQGAQVIYGYTCKGASCTLKRTVSFSGSADCVQTWIAPPYVFCPDAGNIEGLVYKYPAGGSPIATLGLTVSGYALLDGFVEVRK